MHKILLVEDNDMNRNMLERRLVRQGYDVVTAINGLDAIVRAKKGGTDLILMDLSLPVLDGLEATGRLKSNIKTSHIPIIMLTAHALNSDREKSLAIGCDDFDTKPIDFTRLLKKIDALLPDKSHIASKSHQLPPEIKSLTIK